MAKIGELSRDYGGASEKEMDYRNIVDIILYMGVQIVWHVSRGRILDLNVSAEDGSIGVLPNEIRRLGNKTCITNNKYQLSLSRNVYTYLTPQDSTS